MRILKFLPGVRENGAWVVIRATGALEIHTEIITRRILPFLSIRQTACMGGKGGYMVDEVWK